MEGGVLQVAAEPFFGSMQVMQRSVLPLLTQCTALQDDQMGGVVLHVAPIATPNTTHCPTGCR